MEEFYKAIEDKIKASGYPGEVNGENIYNDICDQMEEKENGTYLFLSKKDNGVVFEYESYDRCTVGYGNAETVFGNVLGQLLFTGRHFWNRKCRKKTWWQTVNQSGRIDRTQRCWSYV